jgi:DNA-binding response OmpR family regulator
VAADAATAFRKALASEHRLLLLDTELHGQDGPAVCAGLRHRGCRTLVIFISSASALNDKVRAFESGADDYITRPYDARELMLRIRAVLRRYQRGWAPELQCRIGATTVDLPAR